MYLLTDARYLHRKLPIWSTMLLVIDRHGDQVKKEIIEPLIDLLGATECFCHGSRVEHR